MQKHVAALNGAVVIDPDFKVMDGRKRVDVMLTRQNRGNSFDHLVVELKRPTDKGGAAIITQMLTYAVALAEIRSGRTSTSNGRSGESCTTSMLSAWPRVSRKIVRLGSSIS